MVLGFYRRCGFLLILKVNPVKVGPGRISRPGMRRVFFHGAIVVLFDIACYGGVRARRKPVGALVTGKSDSDRELLTLAAWVRKVQAVKLLED